MAQFLLSNKDYYSSTTAVSIMEICRIGRHYCNWKPIFILISGGERVQFVAKLRQANIPSCMQSEIGGVH